MKIKYMDSFLHWYSQNNKTIIQFLCVCIGLVLIYFIYRIFFAPAETAHEGGDSRSHVTSKQIADLDKKLSKMLDQQTAASKPATFTGEASEYEANAKAESMVDILAAESALTGTPIEPSAESQVVIDKIQNEITQLKKDLQASSDIIAAKNMELNTVKEKLIEHQKFLPSMQNTTDNLVGASSNTIVTTGSNDQTLVAKIDELQRKLQEYDIISDDIAELQSLRAENAELKSKISAG
jgi:myosin heavy subunit